MADAFDLTGDGSEDEDVVVTDTTRPTKRQRTAAAHPQATPEQYSRAPKPPTQHQTAAVPQGRAALIQQLQQLIRSAEDSTLLMTRGEDQMKRGTDQMQRTVVSARSLYDGFDLEEARGTMGHDQAQKLKGMVEQAVLATKANIQNPQRRIAQLRQQQQALADATFADVPIGTPGLASPDGAARLASASSTSAVRLIGEPKNSSGRVAPSWSLVHTNFETLLRAEQRALLNGRPLVKQSGQPTERWDMKIDRTEVVRSVLAACGRATKKKLLCGGTVVKFNGEEGVDGGGLTREMWTLFRQRLFLPSPSAPALFVTLACEAKQLAGAAAAEDVSHENEVGFVPRSLSGLDSQQKTQLLKDYEQLGRLLLVVVTTGQALPSTFAPYVLTYLCADDLAQLADCAAIGTTGSPAKHDAEKEAAAALVAMEKMDKVRADGLRNLIQTRIGSNMTMEELCLGASTNVVVDTPAGRAAAVCHCIHEQLIASRRPALQAMKKGFTYAADLRPALAMFTTQELTDLYLRQVWADSDEILRSFVDEGSGTPAWQCTMQTLQALIEHWGNTGSEGQERLVQLLIWATGSDDLGDSFITIRPAQSEAHMPSASTCARMIMLPPGVKTVEALNEKLVAAFRHTNFGRE